MAAGDTPSTPVAPDGGWGWMVVFASFMIHVIADGVTYSFGVLAIEFIDYFGASREEIGWIGSILVGFTLGAGPISSVLCSRFDYRKVTMAGALLSSVGFGITCFANSIWIIFITIGLLTGTGFGLIYLPAIVTVGIYFEKKRSFAIGLAVCGSGVGTFVFAVLIKYLLEEYTWDGAVLILSGIILNCAACGALFRPLECHSQEKKSKSPEDETLLSSQPFPTSGSPSTGTSGREISVCTKSAIESYVRSLQDISPGADGVAMSLMNTAPLHLSHPQLYLTSLTSLRSLSDAPEDEKKKKKTKVEFKEKLHEFLDVRLMKNPIFFLFILSNFFTSIGFNAPFMYVPDRAIQEGFSRDKAGFLVSVIGIANTAGRIIFGLVANIRNVNRLQLYNFSLFLCGVATILSFLCKTYPLMIAYASAFGLLIGVYVTLTSVVLVDLLGVEQLNSSFGITLLFQGLAVLIGPPLAGWIFDQTQSYDPSFWVCGIMIGMSGVMLFPLQCIKTYLSNRNFAV